MLMKKKQILAICASHYASTNNVTGFSDFANWAKHENLASELKVILNKLGALRLLRQLNRISSNAAQMPVISLNDEVVTLDDLPIGKVMTWYRTALPQEAQARIAYESLLDRFLTYLAEKEKVVAIEITELNTWVFVPAKVKNDLNTLWADFVQAAFSQKELEKNFILLMNSVKLTNRGFGGVEFPVITQDMAEVQSAFYLATLEQRILFGSPEYKQAKKDKDAEKKSLALKANHDTFESVVGEMAKKIKPDSFKRIRELASHFNNYGRNQFSYGIVRARTGNSKADSVKDSIEDKVVKLANAHPDFELPCILQTEDERSLVRIAGDNQGNVCYACGRHIESTKNDKGRSKKVKITANRFILASPSQRLQSGTRQDEPTVCQSCSAIAMISPIKLTDSNLIVQLHIGNDNGFGEQDYLRMMTLGELNLAAGKYLLIKCTEMVSDKGGKAPVSDKMGALQYALFKIATILPRETLRNSRAWLFDGTEQELPRRRMIWLNYLQEIFRLKLVGSDDKPNRATFEAVRLIQKEEVIKAIYALVSANSQVAQITDHSFESLRLLEELRQDHCRLLEEANMPEKAKMFRDIAAMTGLLDAFCDYVRSEASKGGKNAENEVEKLIEEVTDPFRFIYRASHNLSGTMATMFRSDDNYFCFDSARDLVAKLVGDDIQKREGISEKGTRSLRVYFDDVRNAYVTLFENDYKTEKDQKDFATELKLSLAAKFPEYYTKKEK